MSWMILSGPVTVNGRTEYFCECSCKRTKTYVRCDRAKNGQCVLCGYEERERTHKHIRTYKTELPGSLHRKLRQAALQAIRRCTDAQYRKYCDYGGRGIQVCEAWLADPVQFILYLATLPGCDDWSLVLDREDNDGHYEPGNLRFVTRSESQLNRRTYKLS